jgi:hypothetical protein
MRPLKPGEEVVSIEGTMHGAEESSSDVGGFLANVGRSAVGEVAGALDIPGNVTKWAMRNVGLGHLAGPPDYIRRKLAGADVAYEPGKDPPGLATDIGKVIGTSTVAAVPVVGAGARMSTTARIAAAGLPSSAPSSVASGVMQSIGKFAVDHPAKFLAWELFSSTSAGAAGHIAAKEFPETPGARALGEIIGGIGAPLATVGAVALPGAATRAALSVTEQVPALGGIVRGVRNTISGLTMTGGRMRAQERVSEFVSPDEIQTGLRGPNLLPGAPLTPAQKIGSPKLLSLEKSVMQSSMDLQGERKAQFAQLNTFLRDSLKGTAGNATPEDARLYLQTLIDARLRIAATHADQRLANIGPRITREEANIVAREEIEGAMRSARAQERELWAAVPEDTTVPAQTIRSQFAQILARTPQAQQEDIPQIARQLLEGERPRIGETTTVAELQGLRSKLLEHARIAQENKQFNTARIANELAASVLTDLGAARNAVQGEVGNSLRTALDFSADLNERFTKGAVGRLLGYEEGARTVPPGLTLESTIGRAGPRGREEADALMRAAERTGDQPVLRGYMEDFLKDEFRRRAVREGRVDPALGQSYLRERQDLLQRFPQLRSDMETAVSTGMELRTAQRAADPDSSAAAIFLRSPPGDEIKKVLQSPSPRQSMEALMLQAERDSSGRAERGIKAAFVKHLLDGAATSQRDDLGERFISGRALREQFNDPKIRQGILGAFNPDERSRLLRIAETASRLDMAREAEAAPGGIIRDGSNILSTTIAGVLGARVGRALNTGTIQAPGMMANLFRRVFGGVLEDPAEKLIVAAVRDEELFKALFTPITNAKTASMVQSKLNAWAASVLRETGSREESDTPSGR